MRNAPGTCSSTNEKSSAPVIGFAASSLRSAPNRSAAVAAANAASAASLTVTGYSVLYSAATSSPCDSPRLITSCGISSRNRSRASRLYDRAVPRNVASSGITLSVVPAWKLPTVTTTGSNTSNFLVTIVWSAITISQAAGIGSSARCGWEACPPLPRTVTVIWSAAASIGPGRVENMPSGSLVDVTCSAYAATTRSPAASSTPSSIMCRAPA
jgi:hypothetical protein